MVKLLALSCAILSYLQSFSQAPPKAIPPVPTKQQLAWHEMEMNAFVHFTTNTFTNKEWGYGDEQPAIFNPTALNTNQWASVLKETSFRGIILTCKHHDGFCLWPSNYTDHSVKNSNWKNGKGDVVKEVSRSAAAAGLKFGVYLSPWDRNRSDYGDSSYVSYYRKQLKELFSNYGPIFEMWFDGANGGDGFYGGSKDKREINRKLYYDWPTTLKMVKGWQSDVLFFSDAGPDIRWVGNEAGKGGTTNWNTISTDTLYAGQNGIEDLLGTGSEDGKQWVPAEVNTSIRPGWFYHTSEDDKVRSPENLFNLYLNSVGRGSTLLLNIPPDQRGLFHENDVRSLKGFKLLLDKAFAKDIARNHKPTVSCYRAHAALYNAARLTDGNKNSYWATDDNVTSASIEIDLKKSQPIKFVVLQEYIMLGQRIKSFEIDAMINNQWKTVTKGTTIGYKRIIALDNVSTGKIRVRITDSKAAIVLSNLEIY